MESRGMLVTRVMLVVPMQLFSVPSIAQSDPTTEARPTEEVADEAQGLFGEGEALVRAGAYAQAINKFRASFELLPHGATAYNLAFSLSEFGQPVEALRWIDRMEGGEFGELDPVWVERISALRQAAEAELGTLVIRLHGVEEAAVQINDASPETMRIDTPRAQPVDPGLHSIVAHAEGVSATVEEEVVVQPGSSVEVRIQFPISEPTLPLASTTLPSSESPASRRGNHLPSRNPSRGIPAWVWVVSGVALVAAGIGIVLAFTLGADDDALATVSVLQASGHP